MTNDDKKIELDIDTVVKQNILNACLCISSRREDLIPGVKTSLEYDIKKLIATARKELQETLDYVEEQVGKVYCHFTNQTLSKCNYPAEVVIQKMEECITDDYEENIADDIEEARKEVAKECLDKIHTSNYEEGQIHWLEDKDIQELKKKYEVE